MAFATVNFCSRFLNRTVPFHIILPTDKRVFPDTREYDKKPLKTLYLLHGIIGNYADWINGTRLLEMANARNLCVVMPSGDNKFYCDSENSGDFYGRFIGEELVEFTRDTFNLSHKREDTYIGGLSMGGYGAIVNGLRNPGIFSRIIALSSALIKDFILESVDEPGRDFFTRTQYETMFGLKNIQDFEGSVNDYDALAEGLSKTEPDRPLFYMACGTEDSLFTVNNAYKDKLTSLGYQVTWEAGSGVHNWNFWDTYIEKALDWLPLGEAADGISSGNVGLTT